MAATADPSASEVGGSISCIPQGLWMLENAQQRSFVGLEGCQVGYAMSTGIVLTIETATSCRQPSVAS